MVIFSNVLQGVDEDPHTKLNDDLPLQFFTIRCGTWVDYNLQTTIPGCFSLENQTSPDLDKQIELRFDARGL
jgi:succinate dehydrogenase / fumarate reductase flavoprotein subunit